MEIIYILCVCVRLCVCDVIYVDMYVYNTHASYVTRLTRFSKTFNLAAGLPEGKEANDDNRRGVLTAAFLDIQNCRGRERTCGAHAVLGILPCPGRLASTPMASSPLPPLAFPSASPSLHLARSLCLFLGFLLLFPSLSVIIPSLLSPSFTHSLSVTYLPSIPSYSPLPIPSHLIHPSFPFSPILHPSALLSLFLLTPYGVSLLFIPYAISSYSLRSPSAPPLSFPSLLTPTLSLLPQPSLLLSTPPCTIHLSCFPLTPTLPSPPYSSSSLSLPPSFPLHLLSPLLSPPPLLPSPPFPSPPLSSLSLPSPPFPSPLLPIPRNQ